MGRALVVKQVPTGAGPVVSIRCFRVNGAVLRTKSGAAQLEPMTKPLECPAIQGAVEAWIRFRYGLVGVGWLAV